MKFTLILLSLFAFNSFATTQSESIVNVRMNIFMDNKSIGNIDLALNATKAPISVKNFLDYVDSGYYNGLIFHRVIKGFMIQGGGFTEKMTKKETRKPIINEATNRLSNEEGTIAMARTNDPNSATSQFFINVSNNSNLDYAGPSSMGYAVFGRVTKGMSVVNKIKMTKTTRVGYYNDVPATAVIIKSIKRIK